MCELLAHGRPAYLGGVRPGRQVRSELVPARRKMVEHDHVAVRRSPTCGVARWEATTPVAPPQHDYREPESGGDGGQHGRVAERVWTIEDGRRLGFESLERPAT